MQYTQVMGRHMSIPHHKILPSILIVIDVAAAIAYVPTRDYRRVIYWIAAAILTATVTW